MVFSMFRVLYLSSQSTVEHFYHKKKPHSSPLEVTLHFFQNWATTNLLLSLGVSVTDILSEYNTTVCGSFSLTPLGVFSRFTHVVACISMFF